VHREEVFAALTAANRQAATSAADLALLKGLAPPAPGAGAGATSAAGAAATGSGETAAPQVDEGGAQPRH